MELPQLIKGDCYKDERGRLSFNNGFDALPIKRIYTIENVNTEFVRAWQGHKTERRWFSAINGAFRIMLIKVDDWESPSKNLKQDTFLLDSARIDVLAIPPGYISSIQAVEKESKLLVMADYSLKEINDEYRYNADYFDS